MRAKLRGVRESGMAYFHVSARNRPSDVGTIRFVPPSSLTMPGAERKFKWRLELIKPEPMSDELKATLNKSPRVAHPRFERSAASQILAIALL